MKELLHRYCGGAPNRVFRGAELALSAEAAARVRAGPDAAGGGLAARLLPPFAAFLLFRLPRARALNPRARCGRSRAPRRRRSAARA